MTGRIAFLAALGFSAWTLYGCRRSEGAGALPANGPPALAPGDASVVAPDEASTSDAGNGSAATPASSGGVPDAEAPDASPPAASPPDMTSAPSYPAGSLNDIFSKAQDKLIACYLPGKKRDSKLRGKVIVKMTINADGSARPVTNEKSNLEDPAVIACVIRTVKTLRFTKPVEGSVTVTYPFIFRPSGDTTLILPDVGKP